MSDTFSPETRDKIGTIQKLLARAARSDFPAERESCEAKAREMMLALGIDTAAVERAGDIAEGKRREEIVMGGAFRWQRNLWRALAEMNFCFYSLEKVIVKHPPKRQESRGNVRIITQSLQKRHRLIGRAVNVATTRVFADYLESAVEKALRDALPAGISPNSPWAASFREGATDKLLEKIAERFRKKIADERAERMKARGEADDAAKLSTSKALTLTDVVEAEEAGNYDFIHGEGAWARKREAEAKRAAEIARVTKLYREWAAENPAEAKRKLEAMGWSLSRSSRRSGAGIGDENKNRDPHAFRAGRAAGEKIGIDPGVDGAAPKSRRIV